MEKLKQRFNDAKNALSTLEEALKEPFSKIIRDASIQRFEFTFEALWKFLKDYLHTKEGINANSPKSCFREAFTLGLLNEEETTFFLDMTDNRNETSHTYKEEAAQAIFNHLPQYKDLMTKLLKRLQQDL
ncbi:MAG: nucleotidyltransferase substrate binding protein [Elusimicrobia bacterium]|nr:nucleotidyltransferase substrate binding protein [Elusimicrobiota bacterium]